MSQITSGPPMSADGVQSNTFRRVLHIVDSSEGYVNGGGAV